LILCNCVDSVEYCDFIFPSYIKKDDLTIAISTSGSSPALAKHLKIYLKNLIPEERMKFFDKKAKNFINSWSKK